MGQETAQHTAIAAAKIAPAIGGAHWYSMTLNEWVALATLIYIALQIGLLVPKYIRLYRKWRAKK